ncbi:hypothetical protein [Alkalilacustris brevis]|uniref:hypothetical protein n=1 Tax=Alkalilacustris brevis TaxID=2026338 RepID=UPI000E0D8628|nr:hypothetical protein [Alkalilacustris brevis]
MTAKAIIGAALLAAIPAAATSQQVIGEITATLDGEERSWQTLGHGPDSYNTGLTDFGFGMYQVSIHGFPDGRPGIRGSLQIVFGGMEGGDDPTEVEILYIPERMSQSYALPEDDAARAGALVLDRLEADGNEGFAAGRISAMLCFKEGFMATPDPDDCITVEGRFETALLLEDF